MQHVAAIRMHMWHVLPWACRYRMLKKRPANRCKGCHPPSPPHPRSTPVSDAEMRLLTSKPVWRISWCEDERAAQVRCLCARVLGLLGFVLPLGLAKLRLWMWCVDAKGRTVQRSCVPYC